MRERGILFSAPMVRAIIAGTKTQTRRVANVNDHDCKPGFITPNAGFVPRRVQDHAVYCPYGQPGDRLWVRETWGYRCSSSTQQSGLFMNTVGYRADDARQTFGPMPMDGAGLPQQRDRAPDEALEKWEAYLNRYWRQWRPSIHMPRWASRITLEVTGVKVERLQDISEKDALEEGIGRYDNGTFGLDDPGACMGTTATIAYMRLWESINGPGSWAANPWVWVITFKRLA